MSERAALITSATSGIGLHPAEAGAAVVDLVQIPDEGPTGRLFSYDEAIAPL